MRLPDLREVEFDFDPNNITRMNPPKRLASFSLFSL